MKTFKIFALCLLYCACTSHTSNSSYISVLIDTTDSLSLQPEKIDIVSLSSIDTNMWQSVHVRFSTISNIDMHRVKSISIPAENSLFSNKQMRKHAIEQFKKDVGKASISMGHVAQPLDRSIIYRTIADALNILSRNTSPNKHLVIFSDLMENEQVTFYDPATFSLLSTDPKRIQALLEKEHKIGSVEGVHVWLLYDPDTYEANARYMTVAMFYKNLLESKGAIVSIGNSIQ